MTDKFIVLIPCAGTGSRFGSDIPKQYTKIGGQTVLAHTLKVFLNNSAIGQIVLVASANDSYIDEYAKLSNKIIIHKVGGNTRAITVLNGLCELSCNENDWILVHDAVRCCLTNALLEKMLNQIKSNKVGGILAMQVSDTVKQIALSDTKIVKNTLKREQIYLAQTPQMFRYRLLKEALMNIDLGEVTDEASAIEKLGLQVEIVESNATNIKITFKEDIHLASYYLTTLSSQN